MMYFQYPHSIFYCYFTIKSGFPACLKRVKDRKTGNGGTAFCRPAVSCLQRHASALESGILSHKMPTFLILLRHQFLVQIRPTTERLFRTRRPSHFAAKNRQKAPPFLRTAPLKNFSEKFLEK